MTKHLFKDLTIARTFTYLLGLSGVLSLIGPLLDAIAHLRGAAVPLFRPTSWLNLGFVALLAGLGWLARRGYRQVAAAIWLVLCVLIITSIALVYGGSLSPVVIIYTLPILGSSVLRAPRAVIATTLLVLIGFSGLVLIDVVGRSTPTSAITDASLVFNGVQLMALMVQGLATWLLTTNFLRALTTVRTQRQQLAIEREHLHDMVAARTAELAATATDALTRAQSLETLQTLTRHMLHHIEPQHLMNDLVRQLHDYFGYACIIISTLEPSARDEPLLQVRVYFANGAYNDEMVGYTQPGSVGVFGTVIRTGISLHIPDTTVATGYLPHPTQLEFRSELVLPLRVDDTTLGVLCFADPEPAAFTSTDLALAELIADQLALALDHAALLAGLTQRRAQAETLQRSAHRLSASLHVETILQTLLQLVIENTPTAIQALIQYQLNADHYYQIMCPSGDMVCSTAIRAGRLNPQSTPANAGATDAICAERPRSISSYELSIHSDVQATLIIICTDHQSDHHEMIGEFCRQAEQALNNARLYTTLHLIDTITREYTADMSLDTMLSQLSQQLTLYVPFECATLMLTNAFHDQLTISAVHTDPPNPALSARLMYSDIAVPHLSPAIARFSSDTPLADSALADWVRLMQQAGFGSTCFVPLYVDDALQGAVALHTLQAQAYKSHHEHLLGHLEPHLARAVYSNQLFAQREQALNDIQTAQNELLRTTRLGTLGELASGMAHDFNNMLTGVLGNVDLLLLDDGTPEQRELLGEIKQAAQEIARSVRRLREWTSPQRSSSDDVDLATALEEALALTQYRWKDRASHSQHYTIVKHFAPVPEVIINAAELREVLVHLLLNAFDAIAAVGTVTLRTWHDSEYVYLSVHDTGSGIAPDVQAQIFTPFVSTKGQTGLGLGLAVSFSTLKRYGGDLQWQSNPTDGTTFTIQLPHIDAPPLSVTLNPPTATPAFSTHHVLLVDDEQSTRMIVARMLRSLHWNVTEVSDGQVALDLVRERGDEYSLLITDLAMPQMDGWQVAQQVSALAPTLPIVLLTGWGFQIDLAEAQRHGINAVLSKPVSLIALDAMLQSIIPKQ